MNEARNIRDGLNILLAIAEDMEARALDEGKVLANIQKLHVWGARDQFLVIPGDGARMGDEDHEKMEFLGWYWDGTTWSYDT